MAKNSTVGTVFHFGSVRLRVNGVGLLNMTLYGPNNRRSWTIPPLEMSEVEDKSITKLSNLKHEKCQLEITTVNLNDYFEIHEVVIFSKAVATGYPNA